MKYVQFNAEERSALAALRTAGLTRAEIALQLGRHRSTVYRELKRNASPYDGWYRATRAQERTVALRKLSRRNQQFGREEMARVEELLGSSGVPSKSPDTWGGRASWSSATRRSTGTCGGISPRTMRSVRRDGMADGAAWSSAGAH